MCQRGGATALPSLLVAKFFQSGLLFGIVFQFFLTNLKIFLKVPLATIRLIMRAKCAPKKTQFFCQNFPKRASKRLFSLFFFFKTSPAAQKIFDKKWSVYYFRRARKFKLFDLKKRLAKVFEKLPPLKIFLRMPLMLLL